MKRLFIALLLLGLASPAFAAIGATAVWECRTTGNDSNGGFYTSGGTDYSQQDAAELSLADIVANGTTTLTSATGGFTTAMIGNGIHLDTPDEYYEITARTDTNTITVDRTVAANVGIGGKVGGAIATMAEWVANYAGGNDVWVKGNRTISAELDMDTAGLNVNYNRIIGYGTTRGDDTRVVITIGANIAAFLDAGGARYTYFQNFDIDCNSKTMTHGIDPGTDFYGINLKIDGTASCGVGVDAAQQSSYINVWVTDTNTRAFEGGINARHYQCVATDNNGDGFYLQTGDMAMKCISAGNASEQFVVASANATIADCVASKNGQGSSADIILTTTWTGMLVINNIIEGAPAGKIGFNSSHNNLSYNNAFYNNDTNASSTVNQIDSIALTGDPWTDATNEDFSLNDTAGAGAACRAAGPDFSVWSTTTSYPDVGAVQTEAAADIGDSSYTGMTFNNVSVR